MMSSSIRPNPKWAEEDDAVDAEDAEDEEDDDNRGRRTAGIRHE